MKKIVHIPDQYPDIYTIVDQAFLEWNSAAGLILSPMSLLKKSYRIYKRFSYPRINSKAGGPPTERGNVVIIPDDKTIIQAVVII